MSAAGSPLTAARRGETPGTCDCDCHAPLLAEACCVRCKATGYHHGFGEDGHDPDWCLDCGGAGTFMVEVG